MNIRVGLGLGMVVACGGGAGGTAIDASHGGSDHDAAVDAGPALACAGQDLPTTAPDPLMLSGTTEQLTGIGLAAEPGVTVDAFLEDGATAIATATSNDQGAYSLSIATGGVAKAGYVRVTKTGFLATYGFGAVPPFANETGLISPIETMAEYTALGSAAEITTDPADGLLAVRIVDCDSNPVAGALLTSPSGAVFYQSAGAPSFEASATDASGIAFVFNAVPGDTTISGTFGATVLRSHSVQVFQGSISFADLQP